MKLAALLLLTAWAPAGAQSWRTLDVSRQLRDSAEEHVRVEYGAGRLELRPTQEPVLYAMQLRYDEERGDAVHQYDPERHTVVLGVSHQSWHFGRHMDDEGKGDMRLALSPAVPLDLDVSLGAAKATLELGGLDVRNLRLHSGATDGDVRFSSPNRGALETLYVELGAGNLTLEQLGNANASRIRVKSGVGSVDLDFGGTWTRDVSLDARVALGKVAIHVPANVGVWVDAERFLAAFDHEGLAKRGGAYVSANYDRAPYKLRVHVSTVFGAISVDHTAP